jgi:hypothetical protein
MKPLTKNQKRARALRVKQSEEMTAICVANANRNWNSKRMQLYREKFAENKEWRPE